MAVVNFPTMSGGGQPNMSFIKSVRLTSSAIVWNRAGSAGNYAIFSSSGSSGYAYFVGSTTTGVPLNKLQNISHSFTSIQIVGIPNDILNLYKVAVDANTSTYSNPSSAYYQWFDNSLVTSKIEYLSGTGSYTLPVFAMPIADVLAVGGGAGGFQHGPGGGGGGVIFTTLFPISVNTNYSVGAGSGGNSQSNGGNTTFGTLTALGGGAAHSDYNGRNGGCGSGAGKSGSGQSKGGGSSIQTAPSGGRNNFAYGFGGGGVDNSANHAAGGGGGAGGSGGSASGDTPGSGGAGHTSAITGLIYATGGAGSNHNAATIGSSPSGYGGPGSGGFSRPNSTGDAGQNGTIIVRSYG